MKPEAPKRHRLMDRLRTDLTPANILIVADPTTVARRQPERTARAPLVNGKIGCINLTTANRRGRHSKTP